MYLNVTVVQILIRLGANIFNHVAHSQHQLVLNRRHPRVVVKLQDRTGAQEILKLCEIFVW